MKEKLQRVIEENIALQKRAYDLNTRAGENVFPIMSRTEWQSWLEERLNGARRIAEVQDCEVLKLPPLDQELINMIIQENPDEIMVLGKSFSVVYERNFVPQITIESDMAEEKLWNNLPDEGVYLPGGREVSVKVVVEPNSYDSIYSDTDIPKLKESVRNHLNEKTWKIWEEPEMDIPIVVESIPDIEIREYGKCAVNGTPLTAYGTIIAHRIWSSDAIIWKYEWYREKNKAEEKRAEAVAELDKIQKEKAERRQLAEANDEAENARNRVNKNCRHRYIDEIDPDVRDRLFGFYYDSIPSDLEKIRRWTTEAQKICVAAEEKLAEIERKKSAWRELGIKIPQGLIEAYDGDENTAYAFMQKVAELRTNDLDEHIVCNCGRDKVRNHLIEVSGDDDFFLGADPNDVSFYVVDVHYCEKNPLAKTAKMSKQAEEEKSTGASLVDLMNKWNNR